MSISSPTLFKPSQLAHGITLRNRIVMAPMTTWSGNEDGTVSEQELQYIRHRVQDIGLVITGCTHVQENGIGFTNEFAAYDDRFIPSLTSLAQAAKSGGAPAILQIFHAGNKAVPYLIPNADLVSASALAAPAGPFNDGQVKSRALSHNEILDVIHAFGETTRRAIEAGFDGVELHGAHGFLIQNFFSPLFNKRDDEWGGSLEKRLRFPLEVVKEVKRVIKQHAKRPFALGYRISLEEYDEKGLRIADSLKLIDQLLELKIDYLHVSLVELLNSKAIDAVDDQLIIKKVIDHIDNRLPIMAAGMILTPHQAEKALGLGLSLVALGKGLVINPKWVELAQKDCADEIVTELDLEQVPELVIPDKLGQVIEVTKGWFPIKQLENA